MSNPQAWGSRGFLSSLVTLLFTPLLLATQDPPPTSIRQPELRRDAIVGVEIIPSPGERIEDGVILLRDGVIEAVGSELEIPPGYRIHERKGLTAYPGLIEPALLLDTAEQASDAATKRGAHHNRNVVPQVDIAAIEISIDDTATQLRNQGFCTALLLPQNQIFRGHGQVVLLDAEQQNQRSPGGVRPLSLGLDTSGGWRSRTYPGSSMGSVALIRQVFSDAAWHAECQQIWQEHPEGNEPPQESVALDALAEVIERKQPVFIDATSELRALRGARIAQEFDLEAVIVGNGTEFRRVDELKATNLPILLPLSYPKKPEATSARSAEDISLRTLLTWKHAPENSRRVHEAGCVFAFTTHRLQSRGDFRKNLADAIEQGLPPDVALDALTRTPARLLGVEEVLGTIEPGRIGNLVLVEGDIFDPKDSIREVWIAGRLHSINEKDTFEFPETGTLEAGKITRQVAIDRSKGLFELSVPEKVAQVDDKQQAEEAIQEEGGEEKAREDAPERDGTKRAATKWRARNVKFTDDGVGGVIAGEALGTESSVRFSAVLLGDTIQGFGETATGKKIRFTIKASPATPAAAVAQEEKQNDEQAKEKPDTVTELAELPVPLGAYGRLKPPQPETVLFRNARIWTATDDGILEQTDLLISDGKIVGVGWELETPEGTRVVDATGKEITPGLIDCHSHTGIDGSVNEGSQNNTAEVRIGDVLDPDDINWYRQLAGGLTAANQLHGSANPIGGQNAVVKLRWGVPSDKMHLDGAMPGIKFALGENVVRPENRYPDTRMGVAAFLEDAFRAAAEYNAEHARFEALPQEEQMRTMPPRRDLELETLVQILESERLIHCHSYRQDEILMLLRTAERWGFTIGTLQHVLEGYKVAEAIAAHGAGASSFSDWWAYKMEVMDAIPHNGTLMTNVGVLASFNSDSDELARRMNTEAAKAVRYGGLEPHAALKMVTINPARQLRIDEQTGSIEVGKDADLVLWNGDPLSTFTRCEQTWIDGAKYFDFEEDRSLADAVDTQRAALLTEIVSNNATKGETEAEPPRGRGRGQWRGPPGGPPGGRRPRPQPPVTSERDTLLARMLDAREAYLFELIRSGYDPEEIRPGSCGCDEGTVALEMLREEVGR